MPVHLTEENFKKEVLESAVPVLVDFWAEWCMPCKMITPTIKALSSEYKGRFKVAKLNVEEASTVASQYGIMSIPTILIFKDGKIMDKVVGALSKQDLERFMGKYL